MILKIDLNLTKYRKDKPTSIIHHNNIFKSIMRQDVESAHAFTGGSKTNFGTGVTAILDKNIYLTITTRTCDRAHCRTTRNTVSTDKHSGQT